MGGYDNIFASLILNIASMVELLLFVYIIMSLLISFNVINTYNQFVSIVYSSLNKLFEPILKPIRNIMPDIGGMDLSPIVLFFVVRYGALFIAETIYKLS